MSSLNFSLAGKRPFLTGEAKKNMPEAHFPGKKVGWGTWPSSHWEIYFILTKRKLFLLLNCLTLSDWEVISCGFCFSQVLTILMQLFVIFVYIHLFYWIHLKRGKIQKINGPRAGSLSTSTYSSHAGGSIMKILPKIAKEQPAQRFIDSSCILHYLGAHHILCFNLAHIFVVIFPLSNLRFYFIYIFC